MLKLRRGRRERNNRKQEAHSDYATQLPILTAMLESIVEAVSRGDKVTLVGFGSFEPRQRKEREGRNPKTGETMLIPATTIPAFSAGKAFKEKARL